MAHGFKFVRLVKGRYPRYRTKETGDLPLPGPIGSPAFLRRYAELEEMREARKGRVDQGPDPTSWSFLVDAYLASPEYAALADPTQKDYADTCELLRAELVDDVGRSLPFALTSKGVIKAIRDGYAATPRKAHKVKQMASILYVFADDQGWVPDGFNPATTIKRLKRKGGDKEITVWSDAEIDWIFAAAPEPVLTPLMIFLYTGQREANVPTMTWAQFQGDIIRCRASKTGALIDIPCHPALRGYLERLRKARKVVALQGHICLDERGKPFTVNQLNGRIRRLVERVAKVRPIVGSRSPHGLRYAAGSRMIEGGANHAEAAEVLGHRTFKMALKYAGQRVRASAAVAAMPGSATHTNDA